MNCLMKSLQIPVVESGKNPKEIQKAGSGNAIQVDVLGETPAFPIPLIESPLGDAGERRSKKCALATGERGRFWVSNKRAL